MEGNKSHGPQEARTLKVGDYRPIGLNTSAKYQMIFKLDFEKAYDRVNRKFLDKVMEKRSFGRPWRKWINGCLNSSSFVVVLNGSLRA